MGKNQKNSTIVEATNVQTLSNEIINDSNLIEATEAEATESNKVTEDEAIKELEKTLKEYKEAKAKAKKAAQKAEKNELLKLKKECTTELREKLFSLTQLCKTIKDLNSIEALKLATYFEKNSLNIDNLNPEFVAKNYPYKDINGVCLKRVNLYKFNEQSQKNELTGFFYYTKKQFWSVNDVVCSVQRFLNKTPSLKNTKFLYTYKIEGQKRVEELTSFKLELD